MHLFIAVWLAFGVTSFASAVLPQAPSCSIAVNCDCTSLNPGEFSLCDEDSADSSDGGSLNPGQPAMRECRYFANGTIDVPTMTVITAWVPVGSRPCIGDEVPKPNDASDAWQAKTELELKDKFTAFASRPLAWYSPGGEIEIQDPVEFSVDVDTEVTSGLLLGKTAQIRFRPVAARWELSNNQSLFGFIKTHRFDQIGGYTARAFVKYEVDYKYQSSTWVFAAASWELPSNKLTLSVIERERRTLLVG